MAATLSVSITGSTIVSGTISSSISDANIIDLLGWASSAYNPWIQATYNVANSSTFVPTNGQVARSWVIGWWRGTQDAVTKFNRDNALATVNSSAIVIVST